MKGTEEPKKYVAVLHGNTSDNPTQIQSSSSLW